MTTAQLDLVCEPLQAGDVAWVARCEAEICAFPWSATNFADALRAGYSCWLLRAGEVRTGYAILMVVGDAGELLNLGVARGLQGRGLGTWMLERVCETARSLGAAQMFLEVRPSNAVALRLYRKSGFSQIGRRRDYYPAPGGREDALVLRREL